MIEKRPFGPHAVPLSLLGFGCGSVGGLMVRGAPADQERAIARALDAGVNYFDTATQYGNGTSETNLGRVLAALKPADAIVGTKVRLFGPDFPRIRAAIEASLDGSLRRLGRDRVDILHLHNPITVAGDDDAMSVRQVLDEVAPAFAALRQTGKIGLAGVTAVGETAALHAVIDSGAFGSAQVSYNLLNPSAAAPLPPDYPAQDYQQLFDHTRRHRVGVVGIRVLAGGALSGEAERHQVASSPPTPIGSALAYDTDLARARRLAPLVAEKYAGSLVEAAIRFAISHPAMGTILVGMASVDQFDTALAAVEKGPLPPAALHRIAELTARFTGESR